jgi:hypothetical protein
LLSEELSYQRLFKNFFQGVFIFPLWVWTLQKTGVRELLSFGRCFKCFMAFLCLMGGLLSVLRCTIRTEIPWVGESTDKYKRGVVGVGFIHFLDFKFSLWAIGKRLDIVLCWRCWSYFLLISLSPPANSSLSHSTSWAWA